MAPAYLKENRFTPLAFAVKRPANSTLTAPSPELELIRRLEDLMDTGQVHLQHEEYNLALNAFNEAMSLILHTVHPDLPLDVPLPKSFRFPADAALLEPLVTKAAESLKALPATVYQLPTTLVSAQSTLPAQVKEQLQSVSGTGLQITSFQTQVEALLRPALEAAGREDWASARQGYEAALQLVPDSEKEVHGGLLQDLAILTERAGDPVKAQALANESVRAFETANSVKGQAQALATMAGILKRNGKVQESTRVRGQLDKVLATHSFNPVVGRTTLEGPDSAAPRGVALQPRAISRSPLSNSNRSAAVALSATALDASFDLDAPALIGLRFVSAAPVVKALKIQGDAEAIDLSLDGDASAAVKSYLTRLAQTKDIGLLTSHAGTPGVVAQLPRVYFYTVPTAIGDCHAGLGNLEEALQNYQAALQYPLLNPAVEAVSLWTRLAQTILEQGDRAYRQAEDDTGQYAAVAAMYAQIVRADRTLDPASLLYSHPVFAGIKGRLETFLASPDPMAVEENPAITGLVLEALRRLGQLASGLNYFGFEPGYIPPFSFEYLQTTSRYFAEHASQIEQRYFQYKSQAENEEFRREQLDQQAEVARQSVILEQRGVAEAQRGIDVANASLNYAGVQEQNAVATRNDFQNVRTELLELAGLEAWANASSVDRDDQVKLTISNYTYFSADSQRRNVVLQRLALQRTRISNDLEAAKLDRAVASAQAYRAVAQAQVGQAQARKAIAEQRVVIAQLQQRQAEENRDFLDMREFSAGLWYELARQARRIKQRYLDMATAVAVLMERAYNAETERGFHAIRFDYNITSAGNLMGADQLLADIDSFTFDLVTTTRRKKMPIKKTIRLADAFPMQFENLKRTGQCCFETTLADFDRDHPGLYLAKISNVELIFVGISGGSAIAGTLRNIGVSRFRNAAGAVLERLYPADVMVLSQYEMRQDTLAFRFDPKELRLFENNGLETLWQLDLPLSANDFDFEGILDVHLVLYYDGFFDPGLEQSIRASLPAEGEAARGFSMKLTAPDELFYLKNQGEAEFVCDASLFPLNQKDLERRSTMIRVTGEPELISGLTFRLNSEVLGSELTLTTDAQGEVLDSPAGAPLAQLRGKAVFDTWTIRITPEDNPGLVTDGKLDLEGLDDFMTFTEYQFSYR